MMNFTYDKFQTKVDDLVDTIAKSGYSPTVVVGVQRGGLVPATYLSHKLGVPLQVLDLEVGFKEKHNLDYSAILLVDDICDTGQTLLKANWQKKYWY
jgi:hypoxanthine phosphoribosyltransferase